MFAKGSMGNEHRFARVEWGFDPVFTVKATAASTTGSLSFPAIDIIQDPSSAKLDDASINGKLVENPEDTPQFDIVEAP